MCYLCLPVSALTGGSDADRLVRSLLGGGTVRKVWDTGTSPSRGPGSPPLLGYARDGGGFAVVHSGGRQPRVVGYSPDGMLPSPDGMPVPLSHLLDGLSLHRAGDRDIAVPWHDGTAYLLPTPEWGQDEPFNREAPLDGDGCSQAGCLPVALGAIMASHRWPGAGRGTVPSYVTPLRGIRVPARQLGRVYDWSAMEADYRAEATSARLQPGVLSSYFRYHPDMRWRYRRDMSDSDWHSLLVGELASGRPVLYYAARADDRSHAFVIDGVDSRGLFHVNWGWAGRYNGYWDLDALTPGDRDYDGGHAVLVGLRPYLTEAADRLASEVSFRMDDRSGRLTVACPAGVSTEISYQGRAWTAGVVLGTGSVSVALADMLPGEYLFTLVADDAVYSFTFSIE